jgi:hypothetical protein
MRVQPRKPTGQAQADANTHMSSLTRLTSIKSMDLRLNSYQNPAKILSQGRQYVDQVANFGKEGIGGNGIASKVTERVLQLGVPPGASEAQKSALKGLIEYGKQNGVKVEIIRVP